MALEKQLDEVMACLAQALTASMACNADKLVAERDAKLVSALAKMKQFGEELKTVGKGDAYFALQDAVIALARGLRGGMPGPYVPSMRVPISSAAALADSAASLSPLSLTICLCAIGRALPLLCALP